MCVKNIFTILTSSFFRHVCITIKYPSYKSVGEMWAESFSKSSFVLLSVSSSAKCFTCVIISPAKSSCRKIFSTTIFATSLEHSNSPGLFSPMDCQFLAAWSTSISHFEGSTSIPSVLCSLESNGRPKRLFFKLVLPARS